MQREAAAAGAGEHSSCRLACRPFVKPASDACSSFSPLLRAQAIDGGFAATFEQLIQNNPNTVTVSPTYARGLGVVAPSPTPFCAVQRAEPATTKLYKNTLPPVADDPWALDSLDCKQIPTLAGPQFVPFNGPAFVGYPGLTTVDPIPQIHPGTSLPVSAVLAGLGVAGVPPTGVPACNWNAWVLTPPFLPGAPAPAMTANQFNGALIALGTADAAKWATDNGY